LREVITQQPGVVNEVWCRKIFRHILQALERYHAQHQAHAPVTPDTICFDAAGEPVLLPASVSPDPDEAEDVQALGAVVHLAITGESRLTGPLRGRALPGFSDSLLGAVDKCMASDPAERPQSVDELRSLLGIVAVGPAMAATPAQPAVPAPAPATEASPQAGTSAPGAARRPLLIGAVVLVLLLAAGALFALLRAPGGGNDVMLTLPHSVPPAKTLDPNESLMQAPPSAAQPGVPAPSQPVEPAAPEQDPAPVATKQSAAPPAARPAPEPATTSYKLLVKPWGTVYVDGEERGVSPPLKKLDLPAGRHTIRVVNPAFRDRVMRVDAGKGAAGRIEVDFQNRD
jgi:hypothetical protein